MIQYLKQKWRQWWCANDQHDADPWNDPDYKWDNRSYLRPECRVRLECMLLHPDAKPPARSRRTDAGYDLTSVESVLLKSGQRVNVDTGIAVSAPDGYYYTIEGRSSLARKGIMIPHSAIIDGGYTGRLCVVLLNISEDDYQIEVGHRIAQIIVKEIAHCDVETVTEFSPEYSSRGEAGWGSSGQ